jgi:hypothetical protein
MDRPNRARPKPFVRITGESSSSLRRRMSRNDSASMLWSSSRFARHGQEALMSLRTGVKSIDQAM